MATVFDNCQIVTNTGVMNRSKHRPDSAVTQSARRALVWADYAYDPRLAAAWLYYEDALNQRDIAALLGVSRSTVVNYLQEARERGMVEIRVRPELAGPTALSQGLRDRYRLDHCWVIPDDGGRDEPVRRIGNAGARLLAALLTDGDVLGVAWGRTVLALSQQLEMPPLTELTVVQIAGSMTATDHFSPELCTSNIASRCGARCVNLHAPALVSRPQIKKLLMQEPALQEQLALARGCGKIVFGVTHLTADSTVFGSGLCRPDDVAPYRRRGAVAVLAGRFLDRDGGAVRGPLDARMIGLTLAEIDAIPTRLCVAGGVEKTEALAAALAGGHVTALATDQATAEALLGNAQTEQTPLQG